MNIMIKSRNAKNFLFINRQRKFDYFFKSFCGRDQWAVVFVQLFNFSWIPWTAKNKHWIDHKNVDTTLYIKTSYNNILLLYTNLLLNIFCFSDILYLLRAMPICVRILAYCCFVNFEIVNNNCNPSMPIRHVWFLPCKVICIHFVLKLERINE